MTHNTDSHYRRSIRLKDYDYSQAGGYFVTICTKNRQYLFGEIIYGQMVLNEAGRMVSEAWEWLEKQYNYVELDEWVIMPNHMHGIIIINDGRGCSRTAPTVKPKTLGGLIGAFKTASTKRINEKNGTPGARLWQRNYFDRVIRNEKELDQIREYVFSNPGKWEIDRDSSEIFIPRES